MAMRLGVLYCRLKSLVLKVSTQLSSFPMGRAWLSLCLVWLFVCSHLRSYRSMALMAGEVQWCPRLGPLDVLYKSWRGVRYSRQSCGLPDRPCFSTHRPYTHSTQGNEGGVRGRSRGLLVKEGEGGGLMGLNAPDCSPSALCARCYLLVVSHTDHLRDRPNVRGVVSV